MGLGGFIKSVGKAGIRGGIGFLAGGPAGAALAAGSSIYGDVRNRKKPGQQAAVPVPSDQYGAEFRSMTAEEAARAQRMTGAYETGMAAYDPAAYAHTAARAQMAGLREDFSDMEGRRAGSLNRRGLFNSDIGGAGARRDFRQRVATGVAANAQTAAAQRLAQLQGIGAAGEQATARAFEARSDIYGTERATEEQRRNDAQARRNATMGFWGQIGSGALSTAGTVLAARYGRRPA